MQCIVATWTQICLLNLLKRRIASMESNTINIEDIMVQMRKDISLRCTKEELSLFMEMDPPEVLEKNSDVNAFSHKYFFNGYAESRNSESLDYYQDLDGNALYRFIKRVIRKLNTFLLKPIVDQQTAVNCSLNRQTYQLYLYIREQEREIESLRSRLSALEEVSK